MSTELTYRELRIFAQEILKGLGLLPTQINQAEAFKRYTRRRVEQMERQGYLHPVKDTENGSKYFDIAELEEVMKNNNVLNQFKKPVKCKSNNKT